MKDRKTVLAKRKRQHILRQETVQFLGELVLSGKIEVSDIPLHLRINCGEFIYLYGLRTARSVSDQKVQSILGLIMQDAESAHDSDACERLKYFYEKQAGFYLQNNEDT